MKEKTYDVFIIGSGGSGQTVAEICVKNGLNVAIADNTIYGGTCANRGCNPKKILLGATEAVELAKNLETHDIVTSPEINWKALQKFKRSLIEAVPPSTESKLEDLGLDLYHQSPHFINENTLRVEGKTVHCKHIVIATGQTPRPLNIEGSSLLKTSNDFLDLKRMPKHVTFIGAGYIGMEFAHMAARAGSQVTVIDHGKRPLKPFDPDLVAILTKSSKALGITFKFKSKVLKIEKLRKNHRITFNENGKTQSLKSRLVFNTSGRIPAIDKLDLQKGNVAHSKQGISVNSYLQNTSNPHVYACGDVSDHGLPLTPLTGKEGTIVARNILNENSSKINTPIIPSAVFTLPQLASVGLSETAAKEKYGEVIIIHESVPNWYNAKRINARAYAYKIIINKKTKKILGAHLLGPQAAETINIFTMAMNADLSAEQLKSTIFSYPTWCYDIKSML